MRYASSAVRLQLRESLIPSFGVVVVVLGVGSLLLYFRQQTSIDPGAMIQDPAEAADLPSYTGMISAAGILLWCAGAAAGILCGALLWNLQAAFERSRFLVYFGVASGVLTLDD
jgi:hypothetical protein